MSKAIEDVIAERKRQIDGEGWTLDHDDAHAKGELAAAAAVYLIFDIRRLTLGFWTDAINKIWPFSPQWLKAEAGEDGKRKNLVRAAALTIAEIERLDRAEAKSRAAA